MTKDHLFNNNIVNLKITAKPVNLRYLYSVVAIPKNIREQYLLKISKRISSSNQKNVRLLKIIYWHLAEDRKLMWDDRRTCKMLGINMNMLYAYKSRLLRGLREYYFGWKEIEKEEFGNKDMNDLNVRFKIAERMINIGMKKEAKSIFLKISGNLYKKKKKSIEDKLILFDSIKHLCSFYKINRKLNKFNKYHDELEKLGSRIIKNDIRHETYIMMKLYNNRMLKISFYADKTTTSTETMKLLRLALIEAKKLNDKEQIASILYNLSYLSSVLKGNDEWERYIKEGLKVTRKQKNSIEYFSFRIQSMLLQIERNEISFRDIKDEMLYVYHFIKKSPYISTWTQRVLYRIAMLCSMVNAKDLLNEMLYEYNSRWIILDGLESSMRTLYYMKFDHYLKNICIPSIHNDITTKKKYITIKRTDPVYHGKLYNAILELTMNTIKVRDIVFRKEFFSFMLHTDFWKGNSCSYDYSKHIMKQIDYINKTRPGIRGVDQEMTDFMFFGITLMSDSKILDKRIFLKKYEIKFKDTADAILGSNNINDLTDYYMLSFIAEQCGYEELKEIAKKTYWKLEKNHPELIRKEIEKIKSGERVEDHENELMGVRAA